MIRVNIIVIPFDAIPPLARYFYLPTKLGGYTGVVFQWLVPPKPDFNFDEKPISPYGPPLPREIYLYAFWKGKPPTHVEAFDQTSMYQDRLFWRAEVALKDHVRLLTEYIAQAEEKDRARYD